jgi:hypothetical protein
MCPSCLSNIAIAVASVTATSGLSVLGMLNLGTKKDRPRKPSANPTLESTENKSRKE